MTDVKRSYSSDLRADQARRTQLLVVAAARELFEELGYAGTTIDAIAAKAGVSRKTVFTSVGNKAAVLHLAWDHTVGGDDRPLHLTERPEIQRIVAQDDPWEQMRMFADFVAGLHSSVARLWVALRSAAEMDPEAREFFDAYESERHRAMVHGPVPVLVAKGALKDGLSAEAAADLLWTFNDAGLHDRLVRRAGWSQEAYRDWLRETIPAQVLRPEPT